MTEQELQEVVGEALMETPGKAAKVSLILKRESTWIILLASNEEELAVKVEEKPESTRQSIKEVLIDQIRRLF